MHRRDSQRDTDWNDSTTDQVMLTDVYCRRLSFVHNLLYIDVRASMTVCKRSSRVDQLTFPYRIRR